MSSIKRDEKGIISSEKFCRHHAKCHHRMHSHLFARFNGSSLPTIGKTQLVNLASQVRDISFKQTQMDKLYKYLQNQKSWLQNITFITVSELFMQFGNQSGFMRLNNSNWMIWFSVANIYSFCEWNFCLKIFHFWQHQSDCPQHLNGRWKINGLSHLFLKHMIIFHVFQRTITNRDKMTHYIKIP